MPSVLVGVDANSCVVQWNLEAESKTGVTADEAVGQALTAVFPQIGEGVGDINKAIMDRKTLKNEKILQEQSGDNRYADITIYPLIVNGVDGAVIRVDDVTERKKAEEALRDSEEKYRNILESIEEGYFEIDLSGNLKFFNDAILKISGYSKEELMGMNNQMFTTPETSKKMVQVFTQVYESGDPSRLINCEIIVKNNEMRNVELSASIIYDNKNDPIGFRGIVRDISERIREKKEKESLEKQFQQAQKMEAIGTLAGGIAHDFNNILSAIFGYTELTIGMQEKDSQSAKNLQKIFQASSRARDLIKQILTFSRQSELEPKPVKVKLIVEETLKLLRASLPSTIKITPVIQSETMIIADPTQIHQVIMNLCTNAGHAMRENGGVLKVILDDVNLDDEFTKQHSNLQPGKYIQLSVHDTGHGIKSEIVERSFDPFFTTKERGEGTGMGLSVVHGIVRNYGGAITIESDYNRGATFHVYIPAIVDEIEPDHTTTRLPSGGNEKILFIDDEELQVDICKQMLSSLGYKVIAKTSSPDALELFKMAPHDFDLVITDMTMPGMTGAELARQFIAIRADIPIILCTGYNEQISEENSKAMGMKGFVMKPIVLKDLAEMIRKVFNSKRNE